MEFTKDIKFNISPTVNKDMTITYNGFLSNSSELFIVCGYGAAWENTTEIQMNKTSDGFTAKISLLDSDTFNFCFRNSNNEWDNNSNCNYIAPIWPAVKQQVSTFDIDALIEEILQPITQKSVVKDETPIQINEQTIDLGTEITKLLSQINTEPIPEEANSYSSLDEILSGTVISETPIEAFEHINEPSSNVDNIVNELVEEALGIHNVTENLLNPEINLFATETNTEIENEIKPEIETSS